MIPDRQSLSSAAPIFFFTEVKRQRRKQDRTFVKWKTHNMTKCPLFSARVLLSVSPSGQVTTNDKESHDTNYLPGWENTAQKHMVTGDPRTVSHLMSATHVQQCSADRSATDNVQWFSTACIFLPGLSYVANCCDSSFDW